MNNNKHTFIIFVTYGVLKFQLDRGNYTFEIHICQEQ